MYGYTGREKGYAEAMGAPTVSKYPPDSLEARGFVEHRGTTRFEYRITPEGLQAIGRGSAGANQIQANLDVQQQVLEEAGYFSGSSVEPGQRVLREIVARRGQQTFRAALLAGYGSRCLVTGCDAEAALEAAHIIPYSESFQNDPRNGLLLRGDIHTLFDLGLISVRPTTLVIDLDDSLLDTSYGKLHGKSLAFAPTHDLRPSEVALRQRYAGNER